MKTIIFSILFVFVFSVSFAQSPLLASSSNIAEKNGINNESGNQVKTFEFFDYSLDGENEIELDNTGNHFLGKEIAYKLQLMEKLYTFKTPIGPGNPGMKTVIQKADIYNSIHKINKSFKKQVRKNQITEEQAQNEMNHYLEVAIAVISQDTEEFESALKNANSVEAQINILQNTTLRNIYNPLINK